MRAELKLMRQDHPDFQPVSKMKKADISSLLEKMKQHVEITPSIAMTKAEKAEKPMKAEKAEKVKAVAEKPMKAEKAEKVEPKEKAKKETIAERMARIRALKKKE